MAAEANWMDTAMPDGAITLSAATPVLSADIQNPVPIPTAQPPIPTIRPHSIKLHPSADPAGFRSTQQPHPIPGVMVPGRLSLLPSMSAANPVSADALPQKPHLTPSAGASVPAVGIVRRQLPL